MQQYFIDTPIHIGQPVIFTKEQQHHLRVLRIKKETVRLVYDGRAFLAEVSAGSEGYTAEVLSEDSSMHELQYPITLIASLIERTRFEWILQKAAELGVNRIVPLESSRCVYRISSDKKEKVYQRWNTILMEASQQCKRNKVPELMDPCSLTKISQYASEHNYAAYEKAGIEAEMLSEVFDGRASCSIAIGPEGGFSEEEVRMLSDNGFMSIDLGSRILRSETAAVYVCSVASELIERVNR